MTIYNILILGASYGSLLGTKLQLGGHNIKLVCRPATVAVINKNGARVRLPIKGREEAIELDSRMLPGKLSAAEPAEVNPSDYDLVALAMQEAHYSAPEVRGLLRAVAKAKVPCVSVMNMPPPPYLKRIPGLHSDSLRICYADAGVWDDFEPGLMTLCSPDSQAVRLPDKEKNVLQVTLPTNFKASRFESEAYTSMLHRLETDIEAARYNPGDGTIELPVKLKVHESIFVPLAKWAMLLTGNYRCVQKDTAISIDEAVHSDIAASRSVYDWVCGVCERLGANPQDLVPFESYAKAARNLTRPSSAARALFAGATQIERTDQLVQAIAAQYGMRNSIVDATVAIVGERLTINRCTRLYRPARAEAALEAVS
jgi:hypothetical protein